MNEPHSHLSESTELPPTPSAWASFFELIKTVSFVLVVAFLIRHYLIQPFVVDGASMEPNFHHQEYILVDKLSYRWREPTRGDVVVFHPPERQDNFIKRIIGLPGETITIQDNQVTVDGQPVAEAYIAPSGGASRDLPNTTYRVGSDEYFVLGDNRNYSKDSREIGPIGRKRIIGRAWLILFPLDYLTVIAPPDYPGLEATNPKAVVKEAASHAL